MSDYPEHDKMRAVKDRAQIVSDFLEWLTERGLVLGLWNEDRPRLAVRTDPGFLLDQYFDIDSDKVEAEKQQMLADIRAASADLGPGIVGG